MINWVKCLFKVEKNSSSSPPRSSATSAWVVDLSWRNPNWLKSNAGSSTRSSHWPYRFKDFCQRR